MTKEKVMRNMDKRCGRCNHFIILDANIKPQTSSVRGENKDGWPTFRDIGMCDNNLCDHYEHILTHEHPNCGWWTKRKINILSSIGNNPAATEKKDWLSETIDMLLRTRADPRTEVNEESVSQWAKSPKTKTALRAHGITYDELMSEYCRCRDKVA